jgi:hypothetical protein
MITEIGLGGVALDLDTVEYQVSVQHGRPDIMSAPQASSAQIVIRGPVGVAAEIADTVTIEAYGDPRFTGEISDVRVTHLSSVPPVALTQITAMGNLARVGFVEVGASGFSEQTVSQRVTTVIDATGLDYLNGADTDLVLHQISTGNAEPTDALSYLQLLAEWTGATYYDDPAGRIVFESYGNRGITAFAGIWSNQPGTWADQSGTWDDYPRDRATVDLPPSTVVFTPAWSRTRQTILNSVTVVGYSGGGGGGGGHEETASDSASIAAYGLKEFRLETEIKNNSDVLARAGGIITAQANPLWSLGEISIYVHQLETLDRDRILSLVSGMAISMRDLPQPAPLLSFLGIVEGWGEVYTPGQHVLTLSVSDPRYSFQTVTWDEVDLALEWGDVPADLQWYEIITGSDLAA